MLGKLSGAVLLLACASALAAPPAVTLKVGMPPAVTLPAQGKVQLHVELVLTNKSSSPVTLTGSNACVTHTWRITDPAGQLVDDRSICPMIYMPQSHVLEPGEWRSDDTITVDSAKYRSGVRYTLHYRFWGVDGDAPFSATK